MAESSYRMTSKYLFNPVQIYVVEEDSVGGEQSIIIYESPGVNGGVAINAGRMNNERALSGKILPDLANGNTRIGGRTYTSEDVKQQLSNIATQILNIKDSGIPVTLSSPVTDNTTGSYLISSFRYNISRGKGYYLTFTMTLKEYRQANVKSNIINIIGGDVVRALKERQQQLII